MPYPKLLQKFNKYLGRIGGILCFVVAIMFLTEAILRYVFRSPTSWIQDYACYLHCIALFMGCAYTFQVHGHVGVDLVRKLVYNKSKRSHKPGARILAILGYLQTIAFLAIMTYAVIKMFINSYNFGSMTEATYPISQYILYGIMSLGCILMIITVSFIILSLFTKSEEYLD